MRKQYILIIAFSLIVFGSIIVGLNQSKTSYDENQLKVVESNIKKAAIACYSVEGYYPDSIEYLENKYGLYINDEKINVFYQALGSNLFPDIMVTYKEKTK